MDDLQATSTHVMDDLQQLISSTTRPSSDGGTADVTLPTATLKEIIVQITRNNITSKTGCLESSAGNPDATIFRVPPAMREADKDAYTPRIVSLGPYHRLSSLTKMEEKKHLILYDHLEAFSRRNDSQVEEELETLTSLMMQLESKARGHYKEELDMDARGLAEMMLLDGCFILETLSTFKEERNVAGLNRAEQKLVFMDMVMLENQIPLVVLEKLHKSGLVANVGGCQLPDLILLFAKKLHFLPEHFRPRKTERGEPAHLLEQIHMWMEPPNRHRHDGDGAPAMTVPRAVKLREAGIRIKRKKNGAPFDVSFRSGVLGGVLEMSPQRIHDHARLLAWNLVAFEYCHPTSAGMYVMDYVHFLECLVETPEDAALLKEKGVIVNVFGNDTQVSTLINEVGKKIVVNWKSNDNYLRGVFKGINDHCRNNRLARHRAALVRKYFRDPWLALSLLAAIILLLLALLQTIYTILSFYK